MLAVDNLSEISRKRWKNLMEKIMEVEKERGEIHVALIKNTRRSNDLFFKMKKFWETEKQKDHTDGK